MRLQERRRRQGARGVQRGDVEFDAAWNVLGQNALGVGPGARRRAMHGGIGIENAAPIGGKRLSAFGLWQHVEEIAAEIGIEAREHIGESDFDLGAGTEERRAQNDAGNPIRMGLRIGQRQGRAPGTADHDPALKGELFADPLHIRDQMRQRVVLAAPLGPAAPGAALVEQDRVKTFGIEQPAMIGLAAAAGSAMQIDCSNAVRAADAFDVISWPSPTASISEVNGANGSARLVLDFPASASGAMVAACLQRPTGEIAIEEAVVVADRFALRLGENS